MYRKVLTLAWFCGNSLRHHSIVLADGTSILSTFARAPLARHLIIIPAWFGMMAVVYLMTWPWRTAVLQRARCLAGGGVLFAAAIYIYHRSRLHFSRIQVMGRSQLALGQERRLVTGGIRQKIRHPIYLAHLCMLLAWTVGSGEVVLYGLTVFALLTSWPMVRQEEVDLERHFGDEYRNYKRAVPAAFVPGIFRLAKTRRVKVTGPEPENSLVSTAQTDRKKTCVDKTSSSWEFSAT